MTPSNIGRLPGFHSSLGDDRHVDYNERHKEHPSIPAGQLCCSTAVGMSGDGAEAILQLGKASCSLQRPLPEHHPTDQCPAK